MLGVWSLLATAIVGLYMLAGIRIVRPTHRGIIERLGHFKRVKDQGVTWIPPVISKMYKVNITEQIADPEPQEIITKDKLNATVDMHVYFKVRDKLDAIKASQYNVHNHRRQIIALARTTMRNVIGNRDFEDVNSNRNDLNQLLRSTMQKEVDSWGIDIVRCELKEISPPEDVQETMNKVLKASNEKKAAVDYATARETEADGLKRAAIKKAQGEQQAAILIAGGERQAKILRAEGEGKAIQLVHTAAKKFFVGNAKELKRMDVTQASLENNSKIVLTEKGIKPVLVFGEGLKQQGHKK